MDTESQPTDLTLQLPRSTYWQVVRILRGSLSLADADTPEALQGAIAQVASMLPANADEAFLAAQCVGTRLYGMDCIHQARRCADTDQMWERKCANQAASMLRESRQARSLLAWLQAERRKREENAAATEQAAWIEYCAIGLMTDALADAAPVAAAKPSPSPPAPPPASEEPRADLVAEADLYATMYPRRAALIRARGGLPEPCDFGPPRPELVHIIVTGTSPALLALNVEPQHEAAAAG
jgi:hypothetical protein